MNLKTAACLPLLALCAIAMASPPIYPGAKAVDEYNDSMKKAGQDNLAYNTFDAYEKVYEFYKTKGSEVQMRRPQRAGEKFASFKFQDGAYGIAISWKEDSKSKGTVIHIVKTAGR